MVSAFCLSVPFSTTGPPAQLQVCEPSEAGGGAGQTFSGSLSQMEVSDPQTGTPSLETVAVTCPFLGTLASPSCPG